MATPLCSGFETTLNAQQKQSLSDFRIRWEKSEFAQEVAEHPDGDRWLLRFLRASMKDKHGARIFDVNAAEARMKKTLQWRREVGADEIMRRIMKDGSEASVKPEGYDTLLLSQLPFVMVVNTETGDVFRFDRFATSASRVNESVMTLEQWSKCVAFTMEAALHMLRVQSKLHGREISTYSTVVDCAGISLTGIVGRRKFVQFMSDLGADHYPESLGKTWLINCPWYFNKIWNIVKPFIDKDTLSKLFVNSGVPLEELLKVLPRALLLKELGGENDDIVLPHPTAM